MEKKKFKTLVKADHKLGGNTYIEGRISGMAYVICEVYNSIPHGIKHCDKGMLFQVVCTDEQYANFKDMVEKDYPGLCEFYYEESE